MPSKESAGNPGEACRVQSKDCMGMAAGYVGSGRGGVIESLSGTACGPGMGASSGRSPALWFCLLRPSRRRRVSDHGQRRCFDQLRLLGGIRESGRRGGRRARPVGRCRRRLKRDRRIQADTPMRSGLVVVGHEIHYHPLQVVTSEHERPVEALSAGCPDEPLGIRVRPRRTHRRLDDSGAVGGEQCRRPPRTWNPGHGSGS